MDPDFAAMREAMVESQLRTTGVDDPRIVKAMATVPREAFAPVGNRAMAYADMLLPIGPGRALNLPMATGLMLAELRIQAGERVLVIGAATGYAAAVCAALGGQVTGLESDAALAATARAALAGRGTVAVVEGDLEAGWAEAAPYDAILLDGAVDHIPGAVGEQLADNGRFAGAIVDRGVTRLVSGRKRGSAFGFTAFADVAAAVLPGFERPRAFAF